MKGAVAGGSSYTVRAGLEALAAGGNAADAAIAAQLMACVAEPLLTGLGGAGMGIVRFGGEVAVLDLFADVPGLGSTRPAPMQDVTLDYGASQQSFRVGPGSVAVAGVPAGLCLLHERHGTLPLPVLAAPAVRAARAGIDVRDGLERVFKLLWPIIQLSPDLMELFSRDGRPLAFGDRFTRPRLGDTLEAFARSGDAYFRTGAGAQAALSALGAGSSIGREDLVAYEPRFVVPERFTYRGAELCAPGPPSAGGAMVEAMLRLLAAGPPLVGDGSAAETLRLADAIRPVYALRDDVVPRALFAPGFRQALRAALGQGFTTHLSTVDEAGNAVGMTTSLGESCGIVAPETGVLLNNFLGEDDVNPAAAMRGPGERLMTMTSPMLVRHQDGQLDVLGTGGSSRIPSALLHAVIYRTDGASSCDAAVLGPRVHPEAGRLKMETSGRAPDELVQLRKQVEALDEVHEPSLYFGGVHLASQGPRGLGGSGDPRRGGSFGVV